MNELIEYIDKVMDIFTVDPLFQKGSWARNSDSDTPIKIAFLNANANIKYAVEIDGVQLIVWEIEASVRWTPSIFNTYIHIYLQQIHTSICIIILSSSLNAKCFNWRQTEAIKVSSIHQFNEIDFVYLGKVINTFREFIERKWLSIRDSSIECQNVRCSRFERYHKNVKWEMSWIFFDGWTK